MQATKSNYDTMTVKDLKLLCKKYDVKGYSTMKKSQLVSQLNSCAGKKLESEDGEHDFTIHFKKSPYKILNQLVENKKLIVLQKFRDKGGNWVLYHVDTLLVFTNLDEKKSDSYIAIGYLNELRQIFPLTKEHVYICKEWNFDYALPENLSSNEIDSFQNIELEEIVNNVNKMEDYDDDEEDEYLPNYDELLC